MSAPKVHQLSDIMVEIAGLRVIAKCARRLSDHIDTTALVFNGAPQALAAWTGDLHSLDPRQGFAWDIIHAAHLGADSLPAVEDVLSSLDRMVGPAITMAEAEAGQMAALPSDDGDEGGKGRRKSASTRCLEMCADLELWHTPDQEPYTSFLVEGHRETWPINSTGFRRWLAGEFYRVETQALTGEARSEVLGVLSGRACFEVRSVERPAPVRLAHHEGAVYVDLADKAWRQICVTAEGWSIIEAKGSPVYFRRSQGMLALPTPTSGGSLAALRSVFNVANEDSWTLIVAWLVGCFSPGPYPILVLTGQQGTGKSTAGSLLRAVSDPNKAPLRTAPRDERDIAIAASNSFVVAYDNLSTLKDWLSDSLCRLSTGGGLGTRTLYENSEETVFAYKRPCVLTSIEDVIERGDLLDRAVLAELEPIPESGRRTEITLWAEMDAAAPGIVGGLLDAVSGALRHLPTTRLNDLPRMADFALWVTAAEGSLGWAPGTFMRAYKANRADADDLALAGSIIAPHVRKLVAEANGTWEGTASRLLAALVAQAGEVVTRQKGWPSRARDLAGMLKRIAGQLQHAGIHYEVQREKDKGRAKIIHLTSTESTGKSAPPPTDPEPPDADPPTPPESTGKSASAASAASDEGDSPEENTRENTDADLQAQRPHDGTQRPPASDARPADAEPVACGRWPNPPASDDFSLVADAADAADADLPHSSDRDESDLASTSPNYTYIADKPGLVAAHQDLVQHAVIALDTETTGLDPHTDRLRLVTLASADHAYILDTWICPSWQVVVRHLLADPARTVVGHNLAFDLRFLMANGIEARTAIFDSYLASLVLDGGTHQGVKGYHSLAGLVEREMGTTLDKTEQKSGWDAPTLPPAKLAYAADDAAILLPLHAHLQNRLAADGLADVIALENACVPAMAWMAHTGMLFDQAAWVRLADTAVLEQQRLAREIQALLAESLGATGLFGYDVNLDSPVQLLKALAALGIEATDTNEGTLSALKDRHPVIPLLLDYRESAKRAGTYGIEFAAKHLHPTTGRIHADFRQIGAASGRMSCTAPNLQNIPRSKDYRGCFRAAEGHALIKADYAAIELRLAAVIAKDATMLAAFGEGADLHRRTAATVLGIPEEAVTKEHRQLAKALNFGLAYGAGAETLVRYAATNFGVAMTLREAQEHRTRFFTTYQGLHRWRRSQRNGPEDLRTLTGRVRRNIERFTEKLNTPVQGSGADGLKMAPGRLWQYRQEAPTARLVAVVHDEVVVECPAEDAAAVADWLTRHMVGGMEDIVHGAVPIAVEASIARDWAGTPLEQP